jgi:hypothetical protein
MILKIDFFFFLGFCAQIMGLQLYYDIGSSTEMVLTIAAVVMMPMLILLAFYGVTHMSCGLHSA